MTSDKIRVAFFFDHDWLKGYCFGTGLSRVDVMDKVRAALRDACVDVTDCKFKVVYDQGKWRTNGHWGVRCEHPASLEAPFGCSVRRMQQVSKIAMRKALMTQEDEDG